MLDGPHDKFVQKAYESGMKRLFSYTLVVLLGLAFVIPSIPSLSAGTLKVTTPNGGNKWKTGKKYAIKWVKGNGGAFVKIQLLKSNKHYKWVTKKTKNDGKHPWKVPASVATGSAYKIKIVSIKNKKVFDKSDKNFTITKVGGDSGGDDDDTGSIEVSTPDGGESRSTSKKYVIKWAKAMQATSSRFSYSNRESTINGLPKKLGTMVSILGRFLLL